MNIKIERNLIINGAKRLILECNLLPPSLESITLEYCKHIIIGKIPLLKKLNIEHCQDVTVSGCRINEVNIIATEPYSLLWNIMDNLNVDKLSAGTVSNNKSMLDPINHVE